MCPKCVFFRKSLQINFSKEVKIKKVYIVYLLEITDRVGKIFFKQRLQAAGQAGLRKKPKCEKSSTCSF